MENFLLEKRGRVVSVEKSLLIVELSDLDGECGSCALSSMCGKGSDGEESGRVTVVVKGDAALGSEVKVGLLHGASLKSTLLLLVLPLVVFISVAVLGTVLSWSDLVSGFAALGSAAGVYFLLPYRRGGTQWVLITKE